MYILPWIIVAFNGLDGILTYIGLVSFQMVEANPLLSSLDPLHVLFIKLSFSAILSVLITKKAFLKFGKKLKMTLWFAVTLYSGVLVLHLLWLIPYIT
ncbi:DUF5658 family protein [Paenisporosarcina indica]|uniref:DUF5658 family protein n=1 Tax=Paenisporosarcina indica TaxID=650093 RepID=UPI00094F6A0E|nr:DUF5658 family protein [Paenisporosarcina indica]